MFFNILTGMSHTQKALILLAIDLSLIAVAWWFIFASASDSQTGLAAVWYLPVLLVVGAGSIQALGLNRIKLITFGMDDVASLFLVAAALVLSVVALTAAAPLPNQNFYGILQFGGLFVLLSIASRFFLLKAVQSIYSSRSKRKKVLIYGAGQTGQQLAAALQTDHEFEAACFVDDDPNLQKLSVLGLRVHNPQRIPQLIQRGRIERVVLAMPSADQIVRLRLCKRLSGLNCEVLALPSFADIVLRGEEVTAAAPLRPDSLLGRDAIEPDLPQTQSTYRGQSILVTGAGGSIGGELCRQIARCRPQKLILVDHSEFALYSITNALRDSHPGLKLTAVLGSVANAGLMRDVLIRHRVDVVFHAAAYKHVNLVETNAFEGVRNNVFGTRALAEEAQRTHVSRFILVSTDKAVRPTSIMGSTKRLAELVVQDFASRPSNTKFSIVRFGNVLGSSGSVIPLFQKQIREMGPVTVTHPDVTRYFMTVDEAVRLVLLTGTFSRGGDVFALDMGQPVSIHAMARKMIVAAGHTIQDEDNPSGDIPIKFTGLKAGEKMHEELLIGSDMLTTPHPKILRAQENQISQLEVSNALQELRLALDSRHEELLLSTLRRYVESSDAKVVAERPVLPEPANTPTLAVVGKT